MAMDLRTATLEDAEGAADLRTARDPDDAIGGTMLRYYWTHAPTSSTATRWVAVRDRRVVAFVGAGHQPWGSEEVRYGWLRVEIHPELWTDHLFGEGIATAEAELRAQGAAVATTKIRSDFADELRVLDEVGYREVRRERFWELDLGARCDALLARAEQSRVAMRRQGIELLTLADADDEETLHRVHQLDVATTADIPTTVPNYLPPFEDWCRMNFENPAVRRDRFWIARIGDEVVGMSLIEYPPERGVPSTGFTGTSAQFRGRGIARALKYETVAQAIAVGATRVRTDNDSENAPILHINADMGYEPMLPFVELHRRL